MDGTKTFDDSMPEAGHSRPRFRYAATIIPGIVLLADFWMIIWAAVISYLLWVPFDSYKVEYYVFATSFVVFVSIILLDRAQLYEISAIMGPPWLFDGFLIAIGTSFLFLLSIAFSFHSIELYSARWLVTFPVGAFVAMWVSRIVLRQMFLILGERGVVGRSMAVLGTGEQASRFLKQMNRSTMHFTHFAGLFSHDGSACQAAVEEHRVVGDLRALTAAARSGEVNDVVIALPWNDEETVADITERLKELPVNIWAAPDLIGYNLGFRSGLDSAGGLPLYELVSKPISGWGSILKRIEDLTLGVAAIVLLSPLLLLVAILIKIDSPGPVFFRQARLGFDNQPFEILKFRSMYHQKIPETRVKQASKGDPRITRIGRFIRRTSIDELPQLFNVIGGSMSLVGPRPHALSHNEEFEEKVRGYMARHRVKPGITGWDQVNGLRGETDTLEKITARTEHDIYYTDNCTLVFDFRILLLTVVSVLFHKEAY